VKQLSKLDAIDAVASRLSGRPWNSETCGDIAEILRRAGYTIRDLETERVERELFAPTRRDEQELSLPATHPNGEPVGIEATQDDGYTSLCDGCRRDETCLGGDCSSNACPSGARAE